MKDLSPRTATIAFIIAILIGCLADNCHPANPHVCVDSQHIECDGECACDGFECPKP